MALCDRRWLAFGVAGLIAVSVSACGRRGALEPPPGSEQAQQMEQREKARAEGQSGAPGSPLARPKRPPRDPAKPKTPFILDPLIN